MMWNFIHSKSVLHFLWIADVIVSYMSAYSITSFEQSKLEVESPTHRASETWALSPQPELGTKDQNRAEM